MSDTVPQPGASAREENTFRSYSQQDGQTYAKSRFSYHDSVYKEVMGYHAANGAELGTLLDIGCGPGVAIRDLAPHFKENIGLDPSPGMISTAKSMSGADQSIRFEVSSAELLGTDLSPPVQDGSVDIIISSTAAHWFDMAKFWPRAAQILKPGGTVAIWCGGKLRIDKTIPHAAGLKAALDKLEAAVDEYMEHGNRVSQNLYRDLPLPWTLDSPVSDFDKASFVRKEWNTGDQGQDTPLEKFYAASSPPNLDALEQVFGTMSPVTRWRQAHPEAVGTEQDVVRVMKREMQKVLKDAGITNESDGLKGSVDGVLLLVKKAS